MGFLCWSGFEFFKVFIYYFYGNIIVEVELSICLKIFIFWVYFLGLEMYKRFEFKWEFMVVVSLDIMMWICLIIFVFYFFLKIIFYVFWVYIFDLYVIYYEICDVVN